MPRKSTRSASETTTVGDPQNVAGEALADAADLTAERGSATAVAAVVESVRREIVRLTELQELLQFAEVDLTEQDELRQRQSKSIEALRAKHLRRILRFRRLRNGFRELESQERGEAKVLREEVETLRSQLAEAVAMLETARDASYIANDEHKTELERFQELLEESERRIREAEAKDTDSISRIEHLTKELDEACEQIILLEAKLEEVEDRGGVDAGDLQALEQDLESIRDELESIRNENDKLREKCRQLTDENASLADEIADLRVGKATAGAPVVPVESMTWEQRKAAILEQLRREEMADTVTTTEAQSIRQMLDSTEFEIQRRDEELAELRELLQQQSATIHSVSGGEDVAIGAAGIAMMFDSDALIQEERDRLQEIQAEWESKLRQAEVELSLERAKLARGRRDLEQKQADLEQRLNQMEKDGDADAKQDPSKPPRRRWLKQLGLGDGA